MEKNNFIQLNEGNTIVQTDDIISVKSYDKDNHFNIRILYANKITVSIDYDNIVQRDNDYALIKKVLDRE